MLSASAKAARESGEKDLEYVLNCLRKDRNVATKIRSVLKNPGSFVKPKKLKPIRGLTHLLDNRFSRSQYINTRQLLQESGSNILPAYYKVAEIKKECRPPAECLKLSDVCAEFPLQALMNHTAHRLLVMQEEVIVSAAAAAAAKGAQKNELTIKLEAKWGFDGSSNQSQYNQKYANNNAPTKKSDANLFATTMVPLRMTTLDDLKSIVWNNATPQSPRWCRPLRLQFEKETDEITLKEKESVENEIAALIPFIVTIAGIKVTVLFKMYLTMIDGKVLAVITHTKSKQSCCICKANPKDFNNLENLAFRFKPQDNTLNYGLSVLHLWIRGFEWLLHISYRLSEEKWQMRGAVLKMVVKKRKKELQLLFFEKMGLRVDFPSSTGSGNSNSGPVARAAFSKPELLAEILQLDVGLVKRISTMLIALSCQLPLDENLFAAFTDETARYYVSLYNWFPMPSSIHKLLIHSRDIMLANHLSVGVLAEDAAESCNKLYRHNRQFHARKSSREKNLMDVFNRSLDSSDPIVASFGLQKRQNSRHRKCLPSEVLALLKPHAVTSDQDETLLEETGADLCDLDDILSETTENLDELNLPEDQFYSYSDSENDDSDNDSDVD